MSHDKTFTSLPNDKKYYEEGMEITRVTDGGIAGYRHRIYELTAAEHTATTSKYAECTAMEGKGLIGSYHIPQIYCQSTNPRRG